MSNQNYQRTNSSDGLPTLLVIDNSIEIAERMWIIKHERRDFKGDPMLRYVPAVFCVIPFKAHRGVVTGM